MAKPPSRLVKLADVQRMLIINLAHFGDPPEGEMHNADLWLGLFRNAVDKRFEFFDYAAAGHAREAVNLAPTELLQPILAHLLAVAVSKALPQGPYARRHTARSYEAKRVIPKFGEKFADGQPQV